MPPKKADKENENTNDQRQGNEGFSDNFQEPGEVCGVYIRSRGERFCRAGFQFNQHGFGMSTDAWEDLGKEKQQALKNEPELIIETAVFTDPTCSQRVDS